MRWRRVLSVGVVFAALTVVLVAGVADAAVPGVPTGLGVVGGEGQLVLSWTAPTTDGGSVVTGYRIEWTSTVTVGAVSGMVLATGTSTTHTLTGLANGGLYSVTVAAVNAEGTGTATTAVLGTPYTRSGPPGGLGGVLVEGLLVLSWSAPGLTGGATVTGYRVEQRITGGDMWSVVIDNTGSGFTTYNVLGLTGGMTYDFQVLAINAAGMGPMSTSWSTTIPTTTTSTTTTSTTTTSTTIPTTTTSTTTTSTTIPTTTTSLVPPAPCTTSPPPTLAVDPTPDPRISPTPLYVC